VEVEKEVIDIVVSKEQVERVFKQMYLAGNLDTPGMGIMYITPLDKAATYIPPDILKKFSNEKDDNPKKDS
jgi:nitrogen regulatory protein P-II 1